MIYKDDDEMEERSLARDVPRSGQLTMSWGGGGSRLFQSRGVLGKNEYLWEFTLE